ncbi:MAG: GNAT family N-acetyltransferase [Verrucomicrobiaceae bacterium]
MNDLPALEFKIATEDWEFERIHELNYRTFVEEIPQHQPSAACRLVDKFHAENTYLIALHGRQLAGMMAVRDKRPFSLDQKLPDLDSYLPPCRSVCEIRLLAIEPEFRNGPVFHGLSTLLWQHAQSKGYDLAVISGTTRQTRLYRRGGFTPFGPLVGTAEAPYQPMFLTLETIAPKVNDLLRLRPSQT